jgi:O-antigen/teichoic acid export membrane protein
VDERIKWQAAVSIGLSVLRVVILAVGAFYSGSMETLMWLLVAFVLLRLSVLLAYIGRFHGLHRPIVEKELFRNQVAVAAPLGFSNGLYGLRWQSDQWIAAHFFSLASFAAFSVATVLGPVVNVFRSSVNEAFLPSMSRLKAAGDVPGMLALNSKANVMVGTLLYPLLAFAFVFAREVVTVVYTASYLEAVMPMRLYILAFAVMVVEVGSIVLLLEEGRFALKVNLLALVFSVAVSLGAALHYGLPGAAAGGALSLYLDRLLVLRRIAARTGIPVRRLQDWGGLSLALVYGILAALLAWAVTQTYFFDAASLVRLIAGGAVLAATYLAALAFMSYRKRKEESRP